MTGFRHREVLDAYSGGTVRDSNPIVLFSLSGAGSPAQATERMVFHCGGRQSDLPEMLFLRLPDVENAGWVRSETENTSVELCISDLSMM